MRKVEDVTVRADNRDAGKVYRITEMDSVRAEKWAMRAFILLTTGSDQQIPKEIVDLGMVGVALTGMNVWLRSNIDPDKLDPLLDEMMTCVSIIRDPAHHADVATPLASPDDIEEVQTRLWLRGEVLRVHTNFSPTDALCAFLEAIKLPSKQATSPNM